MWPRHSHTLANLTNIMSSKLTFKCTKIEQDALEEIKRIVTSDNLLSYLGFNKEFKIYTNASDS